MKKEPNFFQQAKYLFENSWEYKFNEHYTMFKSDMINGNTVSVVKWLPIFENWNIRNVQFEERRLKNSIKTAATFEAGPVENPISFRLMDVELFLTVEVMYYEIGAKRMNPYKLLNRMLEHTGQTEVVEDDSYMATKLFEKFLRTKIACGVIPLYEEKIDIQQMKIIRMKPEESAVEVKAKINGTVYTFIASYWRTGSSRFRQVDLKPFNGEEPTPTVTLVYTLLKKEFRRMGIVLDIQNNLFFYKRSFSNFLVQECRKTVEYQLKNAFNEVLF